MDNYSAFELRWLDFSEYKDEIRSLRKKVFIEEQEIGEFVMDSPYDNNGLHLGLLNEGNLVSIISLYVFNSSDSFCKELGLHSKEGLWVQFSRRAELKEYRSKKFASLMVAHAVKSVCELFQPVGIFATLMGVHMQLKEMYMNMYGFHAAHNIMLKDGEALIISIYEPEVIQHLILNVRNDSLKLSRLHQLVLPDLAHHIENHSMLSKNYQMEADMTNRYLSPLSLKDELPRLSAQARMLFQTQELIWNNIFNKYDSINNVIDLGCGPGVYISSVSKLPYSKHVNFYGLDIAEEFITYAKFSHPKINWICGNVYETGLESGSFDLVHTSFLFIHLMKPYLTLKEIHRILRDNGLFYIADVNDATFEGPEIIKEMVKKHGEIYEGNREIMLDINYLAQRAGFELVEESSLTVTNTGKDDGPKFEDNTLFLGKWTMWAMFSFMGQRPEVQDQFNRAEEYYMSHQDNISIEIQSKIFKKVQNHLT